MKPRTHKEHLKDMIATMRIFSAVIILVVIIANIFSGLSYKIIDGVIFVMALLIFIQSFQPYFEKHWKK